MMMGSKSSSSKPVSRWPFVNLLLLCQLSVGIGVVGGFAIFYRFWENQCADLLHLSDSRYQKAAADLKLCTQDNRPSKQLYDLQERLESQTDLALKYQDLLQRHEVSLERIAKLEQNLDGSSQTVRSLNEQIKRLQRELGQSTLHLQKARKDAQKQQETLKNQLQLARSLVKQKMDQADDLPTPKGDYHKDTEKELIAVKTAIARQSHAQVLQKYGQPPFAVEFALDIPSETASTSHFQIVFPHFEDTPHAIETFLNLVDMEWYNGMTLGIDKEDSNSNADGSNENPTQATLVRHYAEHGYTVSGPLLLEEVSPRALCDRYSFGLIDQGRNFVIPLADKSNRLSCPGRVSSDTNVLERLQNTQNWQARILSARIMVPGEQSGDHQEL